MKVLLYAVASIGILLLATSIESDYDRGFHIPDSNEVRFLASIIVFCSMLISFCILRSNAGDRAYQDYLVFRTALEKRPLTREQLEREVGAKSESFLNQDSQSLSFIKRFEKAQEASLAKAVYDGRIVLRGEHYGLPGQ